MDLKKRIALACAVAVILPGCATSPTDPLTVQTVPLADYLGVLQTIEVEVGGQRLPFLLDSAGGATLLTPAVAKAIGCEPFGRYTGFRHDGGRVDLQRCGEQRLTIGGESISADTGVFDLMQLLPKGAPTLGGIVSMHTFAKRPFTLDIAAGTLTLESPSSLEKRIAGMREVQVRPSTQGGGAAYDLFLRVEAPKGDLWLEIDSGNTAGLILSPHALTQLGIAPPVSPATTVPVTLQISGFGPYTAPAIVKDTIYDGLVDARFLKAHRLTVDAATGRAWLAAAP